MDPISQALAFVTGKQHIISPLAASKPQEKPFPGEEQYVHDMVVKNGMDSDSNAIRSSYRKAITSPGWSGKYYGEAQMTPKPQQSILGQAVQALQHAAGGHIAQAENIMPTPTPVPDTPIPAGTDLAMKYLQEKSGGKDPTTYYRALQDPSFLAKIKQADTIRPGLSNLLLMQAFNESTAGNANNGNNIFGALPGGETSGNHAAFAHPSDAVDYQLGPNVLGGGGNPNMNIMHESTPLTLKRVQQLYKSYNPQGAYLDSMLKALDASKH